jgi:hypothetical protein
MRWVSIEPLTRGILYYTQNAPEKKEAVFPSISAFLCPLPAKIHAGEGLAQVVFFESDEPCEISYAKRTGKYQNQTGITLPKTK